MERKTVTTLGRLRVGDSFVYKLSRGDVWRVMALADKKRRVAVNIINVLGQPIYKRDDMVKVEKSVVFLRHTVPVPGEEIFLDDLSVGDILYHPDNIIEEYEVLEKRVGPRRDATKLKRLRDGFITYAGIFSTVVFVKSKEV